MTCRICLEESNLIQPCNCRGTSAFVHEKCLLTWLNTANRTSCEICKFEYDIEEVEEQSKVCCPKYRFSDKEDFETVIVVLVLGLFSNFVIMFLTTFFKWSAESMFVYGNIAQAFMIFMMKPIIRPLEVFLFWKVCSSSCLIIISSLTNDWTCALYECVATFFVGLHTYVHLMKTRKQTVRYINIVDRSSNVEAVSGP